MATLPESLESFLASYPHPCFALQASPLHGALTTRQSTGYETASREGAHPSRSVGSNGNKGPHHSAHSSAGRPAPRPSNAEEILSTAFGGNDPTTLAAGAPAPSHSSLLEGGSQQAHHPSRTAEGAVAAMYEQRAAREIEGIKERKRAASFDEGRKVAREGAEQKERDTGGDKWSGAARNMEDGVGGDRGREGMGAGLDELLTPVWTNNRWDDLVRRHAGKGEKVTGPEITLMSLMGRADVQKVLALLVQVTTPSTASTSASRSDNTITLTLSFPPHSANYRSSRRKHRSSVPTRSASTNTKPDLKANAYNATGAGSVSSNSTTSSSSSRGISVEADYNFQLVATWLEKEDLVVITSIATNIFPSTESITGASMKNTSNKTASSSSSRPPPLAPHPIRPVLTHSQPSPTIGPTSSSTPSDRPTTSPSPSPSRALEPIDETSASSASSDSGAGSGTGKAFPTRPSLQHRESANSGASGSSSVTVTAQSSTTSNSTVRTPTATRPGTRFSSSSSSNVLDGAESPEIFPRSSFSFSSTAPLLPPSLSPLPEPLPTDRLPEPLPLYTGKPSFDNNTSAADVEAARAAALMLIGSSGVGISDPAKEYLMEKRKKRKAKREKERREREAVVVRARGGGLEEVKESGMGGRAGEERELTFEEEKVQGRREREARKWREEMEAREDAEDADEEAEDERRVMMMMEEESERSELDERMDRELDALRGRSRDGSGDEGGLEGDIPRSTRRDDIIDSDNEALALASSSPSHRPPTAGSSSSPLVSSSDELPSPLSFANLRLRASGGDDTQACINAFLDIIKRTPTGRLIAAHPWEKTNLGPIKTWSSELRSMVMLCLASPFRASLWWGSDSVLIYNDEYARLLAKKHPGILGLSGAVGWAELWDTLGPLAARVMQGETVSYFDHHLPMLRDGFLEETYHIWSYIPFRDREGKVVGYENTSFETTARVIAERRLATMRDLAQITQLCRTKPDYYQKALEVLAHNPLDLPFVILYSCEVVTPQQGKRTAGSSDQGGSRSRNETASGSATLKLTLQGTVGVPDGHPSSPAEYTTRIEAAAPSTQESILDGTSDTSSTNSNTGTTASATTSSHTNGTDTMSSWPFQEACSSRKPVFIGELAGRNKGFQQRGWPSELKHAVVIPLIIEGDTSSIPKACVVVGLNPRRPWDELFATFISMLSRTLSTGLLNVIMAETETHRTEELLQLDKARTAFISNTSHELRTPLTLILGPLEDVLSNRSLRTEDREKLLIVQRHGNRLLSMINSLLDFSRLEGGKMETTFRPVQLSAMTADLASLFRSAVERGGIELIVDCPPEPTEGKPVYMAAELYEKVVFNLLGNAFKYTIEGTIIVKVVYETSKAILSIIDTGCGIAEHELGLIFDRFHRVETTSRSTGGTGIGLALTLELVKVLGGTLTVESVVGKGSTFSATFPRGSAHLPASQVFDEAADPVSLPPRAQNSLSVIEEAASWKLLPPSSPLSMPGGIPRAPSSATPARTTEGSSTSSDDPFVLSAELLDLRDSTILLADDNADLRQYIGALLGKAFRVVQVEDGQEALEYCRRSPPSLVVSDVMMPRLDGTGLLTALRSDPSTALIPVIFLSAQAGPEARVEALLSGADDYLVKPFQGKELLARVNIHLQLGKMRLELERRVEERTRALIESEMRYRGLADRYSTLSLLSPVGIFMADSKAQVNYANPRFFDISGIQPDGDVAGWRSQVMDEYRENVDKTWKEATIISPKASKTAPVVTTMEFRWKAKQNWVLFEIRPFAENGIQRGFVGSITDISAQKRVEQLHIQEVERRATDAEETRRQTNEYLDLSSHELRNPLSGVWQNAQVVGDSLERFVELIEDLQDGDIPDDDTLDGLLSEMHENVEAVESIILCASHQQRIADDILNVSKLNMGLLSIASQAFSVMDKVREVVAIFSVECQQKAIKLTLDKGDSLQQLNATRVIADPGRLNQCLINFITNGVKYTAESKRRTITIHVDAFTSPPPQSENAMRVIGRTTAIEAPLDSDTVWIRYGVEDSGKGLSKAELEKLFARFSQANPKSDQYGGSGLGLYVSKKLIELHHGFIEVESIPGQGSTFRFAIPAKRAPPLADGEGASPSGVSTPSGRKSKSRTGSSTSGHRAHATVAAMAERESVSCHVLIVEDNLINQKVLSRQLKIAGHSTTIANNGREGLDILLAEATKEDNTSPIEVVLMDIEMPVMGGLEAIKLLREMEESGVIPQRYPVIAVTGNGRQEQQSDCLQAGFDNLAVKPYKINQVLMLIQLGLEGRLRDGEPPAVA